MLIVFCVCEGGRVGRMNLFPWDDGCRPFTCPISVVVVDGERRKQKITHMSLMLSPMLVLLFPIRYLVVFRLTASFVYYL